MNSNQIEFIAASPTFESTFSSPFYRCFFVNTFSEKVLTLRIRFTMSHDLSQKTQTQEKQLVVESHHEMRLCFKWENITEQEIAANLVKFNSFICWWLPLLLLWQRVVCSNLRQTLLQILCMVNTDLIGFFAALFSMNSPWKTKVIVFLMQFSTVFYGFGWFWWICRFFQKIYQFYAVFSGFFVKSHKIVLSAASLAFVLPSFHHFMGVF